MAKVLIFQDLQEAQKVIPLGEKRLVRIGDRRICLLHLQNGFKAIEDECPHMSDSLTKGTVNPYNEIVCPWHSYRFDLRTGEEAERRCRDLKIYPVDQEDGLSIVIE